MQGSLWTNWVSPEWVRQQPESPRSLSRSLTDETRKGVHRQPLASDGHRAGRHGLPRDGDVYDLRRGDALADRIAAAGGEVERTLLVRLNPAVEHKTRGTPRSRSTATSTPRRRFELAEDVLAMAEIDDLKTNLGAVVADCDPDAVPESIPDHARRAIRELLAIDDARDLIDESGFRVRRRGERPGPVRALAAVGAWRRSTTGPTSASPIASASGGDRTERRRRVPVRGGRRALPAGLGHGRRGRGVRRRRPAHAFAPSSTASAATTRRRSGRSPTQSRANPSRAGTSSSRTRDRRPPPGRDAGERDGKRCLPGGWDRLRAAGDPRRRTRLHRDPGR